MLITLVRSRKRIRVQVQTMNEKQQEIYEKELTQFDRNCISMLDVVTQQLARFDSISGMTSEEVALMQVKAGLTLYVTTRQDYILNHKVKDAE